VSAEEITKARVPETIGEEPVDPVSTYLNALLFDSIVLGQCGHGRKIAPPLVMLFTMSFGDVGEVTCKLLFIFGGFLDAGSYGVAVFVLDHEIRNDLSDYLPLYVALVDRVLAGISFSGHQDL